MVGLVDNETRSGRNFDPGTPVAPRLSIVVLPFNNLSNDPDQQYFADGITEELTTELSRIPDMLVISRNTAFTYRNRQVDTRQIGRELGVRYVLEGSVRRSGTQVRVNAQLIDAETDAHLWAERFDATRPICSPCKTRSLAGSQHARHRADRCGGRPSNRTSRRAGLHFPGTRARWKPPSRDNTLRRSACSSARWRSIRIRPMRRVRWRSALTARVLNNMTDSPAADIERAEGLSEQALAASPRSPLAHYAKGQVAARAATIRGGHSRIRDGARVQSQLGMRIFTIWSTASSRRVDRGDNPTR